MKKSIQEILGDQMPVDLSKPVIVTVDVLKDCDLSTMPHELRVHIIEKDRTVELQRSGGWLRVRTFAQLDYTAQDGESELENLSELAFALIWSVCPDESPDAGEQAWPLPPLSAVSLHQDTTIEAALDLSRNALETMTTFFAKDLLMRAANQMKFKPVAPEELAFQRT